MKETYVKKFDNSHPAIIAIGQSTVDINFSIVETIKENHKYRAEHKIMEVGGPAANAAAVMARWGDPGTVYLGSAIGNDIFGDYIRKALSGFGIADNYLFSDEEIPTPISNIVTNSVNGARTIINHRLAVDSYPVRIFEGNNWAAMLCDGHCADAALAFITDHPDVPSILDAGSLHSGTEKLCSEVQFLIGSVHYASAVSGVPIEEIEYGSGTQRVIDKVLKHAGQCVAITCGEKGAWFFHPDTGYGRIRAIDASATDTTAAGDIFHGAFAFCIAEGMNFTESMMNATIAAGLSTERRGGMSSIPDYREVKAFRANIDLSDYIEYYN